MQSAEILQEADDGWKSIYRVSSLDGLLFYHSSFPTVENDAVFFGPDTYRFARSIQQFLSQHNKVINKAVDIGSGSGVGAALIALAFPKANVIALDINSTALDLADINFAAAGLGQIIVKQSNLLSNVDGNFDLIVANPPYLIDESQRAYRHGGGETGEGLSLEIVDAALTRLNPNGVLLLYSGVAIINGQDAFLDAITQKLKFAAVNYSYNEIDPDIFGEELAKEAYVSVDRIAAVVLIMHKHPA